MRVVGNIGKACVNRAFPIYFLSSVTATAFGQFICVGLQFQRHLERCANADDNHLVGELYRLNPHYYVNMTT